MARISAQQLDVRAIYTGEKLNQILSLPPKFSAIHPLFVVRPTPMLANFFRRTAVFAFCTLTLSPAATLPALARADALTASIAPLPQDSKFASVYEEAKAKLPEDLYILYRIVERIARANDLDDYPWRVTIGEADEMNAYATEENLTIVSFGLLDRMAGDVSALACVVAHEMAHHIRQHSAIYTSRVAEWQEQLDSENEEDRQKLEEESAQLRRAQELEADAWGYRYAATAGFDISGCERGFNLLSRLPDSLRDSDSHPAVPKRIEALKALMAAEPSQTLAAKGALLLKASQPLSYKLIEEEEYKWLRINSQRGGSFQQDWERLFPDTSLPPEGRRE